MPYILYTINIPFVSSKLNLFRSFSFSFYCFFQFVPGTLMQFQLFVKTILQQKVLSFLFYFLYIVSCKMTESPPFVLPNWLQDNQARTIVSSRSKSSISLLSSPLKLSRIYKSQEQKMDRLVPSFFPPSFAVYRSPSSRRLFQRVSRCSLISAPSPTCRRFIHGIVVAR